MFVSFILSFCEIDLPRSSISDGICCGLPELHCVSQSFTKQRPIANESSTVLYILFTHPDYQRCGAGSIHVKWGTDLADRLLVPCWVEASHFGHHLYEQNGFQDVEKVCTRTKKWVNEYTVMRRDPKTRLDAGRSVILNGH
jgi:hypothetical protein